MIYVDFDPHKFTENQQIFFRNWVRLAERAQARLDGEKGEKRRFQSQVWGTLKQWLLAEFFCHKCAYCEINIEAGFVGDAEHYRPKGAVADQAAHSGYY